MRSSLWLAVAAAVVLSGCSYLMIDRPPNAVRRGDTFPACTQANVYPLVDLGLTAFTALGAVLVASGFARADTDDMMKRELTRDEKIFATTGAVIEAGLFALSARHGFIQTRRCRALQPTLGLQTGPPGATP